jgi:prepilin-type processing-associated H-X9-DG protein
MYEYRNNHDGDGFNLLFADGHVEFYGRRDANRLADELQAGHNPPRPEMLRD